MHGGVHGGPLTPLPAPGGGPHGMHVGPSYRAANGVASPAFGAAGMPHGHAPPPQQHPGAPGMHAMSPAMSPQAAMHLAQQQQQQQQQHQHQQQMQMHAFQQQQQQQLQQQQRASPYMAASSPQQSFGPPTFRQPFGSPDMQRGPSGPGPKELHHPQPRVPVGLGMSHEAAHALPPPGVLGPSPVPGGSLGGAGPSYSLSGPSSEAGASTSGMTLAPPPGSVRALSGAANSLSSGVYPPGAAMMRLLHYSEGFGVAGDVSEMEYWRNFISEFFTPDGMMRYTLWNPTSAEHKTFDIPASVLPRFMHTNYQSGLVSAFFHLDDPREFVAGVDPFPSNRVESPNEERAGAEQPLMHPQPSAAVSHIVQADRTTMVHEYRDGWQVHHMGAARACFVSHTRLIYPEPGSTGAPRLDTALRLESMSLVHHSHATFMPTSLLRKTRVQEKVPADVVAAILAAHGVTDAAAAQKKVAEKKKRAEKDKEKETEAEGEKEEEGYSFSIERPEVPELPVEDNEYGITLRTMRCLEITESICHLRDLMDFSSREGLGPIDALRRLAAQFRESQGLSSAPSNDSLNAAANRGLTQNGGSTVGSPNSTRNPATVASPSGSGGSGGAGTGGAGSTISASHSQRLGEDGEADTDVKEVRAAPVAPAAATGKRKLTAARAGSAQSPKTPAAKRQR